MERKKKTSYNVLPSSIRSIHDKKLKENEEKSRNLLSFFLLHVISNVCARAISVEISNKIRKIVSRISSSVRRDVDHKFIPSKSFPSHVKIFRPLLNVIGFFFRRDSLLGSVIFFFFSEEEVEVSTGIASLRKMKIFRPISLNWRDAPMERAWGMRGCILFFGNNQIFWIAGPDSREILFHLAIFSFFFFLHSSFREKREQHSVILSLFFFPSLDRLSLQILLSLIINNTRIASFRLHEITIRRTI